MTKRASLIGLLFFLMGCGSPTPAPEYPHPSDPPLEETSLGEYIEDDSADEVVEDDDSWDRPTEDEASGEGEGSEEEPEE